MEFKSDIEIAQQAKLRPIQEIADKAGIPEEYVIPYGRDKAKISLDFVKTLEGKPNGCGGTDCYAYVT